MTIETLKEKLDESLNLYNEGKYQEIVVLLTPIYPYLEAAELWEDCVKCLVRLSNCYRNQGMFTETISHAETALQIALDKVGVYHILTASAYNSLGSCHHAIGQYDKAIHYFEQSLHIRLQTMGELNVYTATAYNNLGIMYDIVSDRQKAQLYFEKGLSIRLQVLKEWHPEVGASYENLGINHIRTGDFGKSLGYFFKALNIYVHNFGINNIQIALVYQNISVCLQRMERIDLAIHYLQKQYDLMELLGYDENYRMLSTYHNFLTFYTLLGEHTKALEYGIKHEQVMKEVLGEQHPDILQTYLGIGRVHILKQDFTAALSYLQKSLALALQVYGSRHTTTALIYLNLAQYHYATRQLGQTLPYLQKSLQALNLSLPDDDYYHLPPTEGVVDVFLFLDTFTRKQQVWHSLYQQEPKFAYLAACLAHSLLVDEWLDQLRNSFKSEDSKLIWAATAKTKTYEIAMSAAWQAEQLYHTAGEQAYLQQITQANQDHRYNIPLAAPIQLAFHFAEKVKALLLYSGIIDADARISANVPAHFLENLHKLRSTLTYLELRIAQETNKPPEQQDIAALSEWQSQYFDHLHQYNQLIEQLETQYPQYYQLKYQLQPATISQVQAALPTHSAMLSFVLGESAIYLLVITPTQSHWTEAPMPADLPNLVEKLLAGFHPFAKEDYLMYAHDFYTLLIQPIEHYLADVRRLIIIPDGALANIPFEALLTQSCPPNTPYTQLPYLLHRFTISYHYSATLWHRQQLKKQMPVSAQLQDFVAFAPIYSNTATNPDAHDIDLPFAEDFWEQTGLTPPNSAINRIQYAETAYAVRSADIGNNYVELLHSETEVRNAAQLFAQQGQTARILLHSSATLQNFTALAAQYRYILVAAHADYNDEQPEQTGIIFSPNATDGKSILHIGDAYNLSLHAELVVLSCCETGVGKMHKGEGIKALNRGFLFSGAKNVIYTLFKIYDKTSPELTTQLFTHITAGKNSASALHHAKLQLIQRNFMPICWAGFVLVGE